MQGEIRHDYVHPLLISVIRTAMMSTTIKMIDFTNTILKPIVNVGRTSSSKFGVLVMAHIINTSNYSTRSA